MTSDCRHCHGKGVVKDPHPPVGIGFGTLYTHCEHCGGSGQELPPEKPLQGDGKDPDWLVKQKKVMNENADKGN